MKYASNDTNYKDLLQSLLLNQKRLCLEFLKPPYRPVFKTVDVSSRGTLLIGPRGVGKTTFLLLLCQKDQSSLYLSLDSLSLANLDLYSFGEFIYMQGYRTLLLDEIHFRPQWTNEVKSLYDSFPKLKIIVSDSSSLVLRQGNADLSRRFPLSKIPLLSFREFLNLKTNTEFPSFNPIKGDEIPEAYFSFDKSNSGQIHRLFEEYLDHGQRPIFLEGRYDDRIKNIIDKILFSDVPYFVPQIEASHLSALRGMIQYLAVSAIPTINISSLTSQWEIGKHKVYELLRVLQEASVLNIVHSTSTPKAFSKGDKILFADCSFYNTLGPNIGARREAFFVSVLMTAGYTVLSSKDEEQYDFEVQKIRFEVGGRNKKRKKSDVVIQENLDIKMENRWPLWILGCLW
jgi:predicted AAA+ superfamily ATPase